MFYYRILELYQIRIPLGQVNFTFWTFLGIELGVCANFDSEPY